MRAAFRAIFTGEGRLAARAEAAKERWRDVPEIQEITRHESRAGYRLLFDPDYHFSDLGFRCAKSP